MLARCQLLLTDIRLPGASGLALAERCAEQHPKVRVLLTSGYVEDPAHAAVIESGKLVSAAKVAFAGDIIESNEDLMENPLWLERDMYGKGWLVVLKPDDPLAARRALLTAAEAVPLFRDLMAREKFDGCGESL